MQALLEARQQLQRSEERSRAAEQELATAFGTIRQLQAQLAETPEDQREMAESAWLAGMDDTWYAKLQATEQRAAEAEAHLRAVTRMEWMTVDDDGNLVTVCPWCRHSKSFGHRDCPRQAAAAWLEAGE